MKLLFAVLAVLTLTLQHRLWFGDGSLAEVWQLHRSIEAQKAENLKLAERNRALQAEVRDLKQGLEAIEERARSELGMVRRGETFFHVIEESPSIDPP
jgi:cell division protein FtsB